MVYAVTLRGSGSPARVALAGQHDRATLTPGRRWHSHRPMIHPALSSLDEPWSYSRFDFYDEGRACVLPSTSDSILADPFAPVARDADRRAHAAPTPRRVRAPAEPRVQR